MHRPEKRDQEKEDPDAGPKSGGPKETFVRSLQTLGMGVCIGAALLCLYADDLVRGNGSALEQYPVLFQSSAFTTFVGFFIAMFARRTRPIIARLTLAACAGWVMWAASWAFLPRL